jgi:hypothetical protein
MGQTDKPIGHPIPCYAVKPVEIQKSFHDKVQITTAPLGTKLNIHGNGRLGNYVI